MEASQKTVRGYLKGELVFDTNEPRLVWEVLYLPAHRIPEEDVVAGLVASGESKRSPSRGDAELLVKGEPGRVAWFNEKEDLYVDGAAS